MQPLNQTWHRNRTAHLGLAHWWEPAGTLDEEAAGKPVGIAGTLVVVAHSTGPEEVVDNPVLVGTMVVLLMEVHLPVVCMEVGQVAVEELKYQMGQLDWQAQGVAAVLQPAAELDILHSA